jgi:sugar lactone lactonase YvrE
MLFLGRFYARADPFVTPVTGPVVHGEGPHWDSETGVLFFVDIESEQVNKYDPATDRVTRAQFGESAHMVVMLARQVLHCTLFHYALSTVDVS